MEKWINLWNDIGMGQGILETLAMVFFATILAYLIGTPMGILMIVSDKKGLHPHTIVHKIMGAIINLGRSIPFIILLVALFPITRWIMNTTIGVKGMIIPLSMGAIPFVARMIESSLKEVDQGVIDAAKCMGCTNGQIIWHVYIKESIPAMMRGLSITTIMLIGYSAMSGAVGGGGLGNIAIEYGYYKFDQTTMLFVLVVLIILVQIIQIIFECLAKLIDKK